MPLPLWELRTEERTDRNDLSSLELLLTRRVPSIPPPRVCCFARLWTDILGLVAVGWEFMGGRKAFFVRSCCAKVCASNVCKTTISSKTCTCITAILLVSSPLGSGISSGWGTVKDGGTFAEKRGASLGERCPPESKRLDQRTTLTLSTYHSPSSRAIPCVVAAVIVTV